MRTTLGLRVWGRPCRILHCFLIVNVVLWITAAPPTGAATNYTLIGWNNLGMHCMDSDFSVFSILPPYNTIHAQVILSTNAGAARLVINSNGYTVAYQATGDPAGSTNRTSRGRGNFWDYVGVLFGANLAMDQGLPVPTRSFWMPGATNTPQPMDFEFMEANFGSTSRWFAAYGVPITPYDDTGKPNQYPMMRLVLKDNAATTLKTTDIVLPVSDEMDCKLCHLSGSGSAGRPAAGWSDHPNPGQDYRLNIIRLHDERQWASNAVLYTAALASNSYNAAGLYATVAVDKHPFVCATCHKSEALPIPQLLGIKPLTTAIHGRHAGVLDPRTVPAQTLDAADNRTACYACHPGSVTRCLRGAMGKAIAADGSMQMQCQSCHGSMSDVGGSRTGWVDEPDCQACHTGDAVSNSGQIRYVSAFDSPNHMRVPGNRRFATTPDTPAAGASLYRFSKGHGNLQCAACHGSTHAEYPSALASDNQQNVNLQGHAGMLVECEACHGDQPSTISGGPHGLHPIGKNWTIILPGESKPHASAFNAGNQQCQACHGTDYTGTVLSHMQKQRTIDAHDFGTRSFWRGQRIGCFDCHNGVIDHGNPAPNAPGANDVSGGTVANTPVNLALTGANAISWRVVDQPTSGAVGITGSTARYSPAVYAPPGLVVTDRFTFASFSGYRESRLATGTVSVVSLDSVKDGIPDWWRAGNFGGDGTTTNGDSCASGDPDGDGQNNFEEYMAGTQPRDGRSAVRICGVAAATNNVRLDFTSLLGQKFSVEARDSLNTGAWSNVSGTVWGRTDTTPFTDTNGAATSRQFYRVRIMP